jgi:hypothetical protein
MSSQGYNTSSDLLIMAGGANQAGQYQNHQTLPLNDIFSQQHQLQQQQQQQQQYMGNNRKKRNLLFKFGICFLASCSFFCSIKCSYHQKKQTTSNLIFFS